MRTRSSASASHPKQEQPSSSSLSSSSKPATVPEKKPSKTFILPSTASDDADSRLIILPNPRTGSLNRYFFSPKHGLYEFTVIASPSPRTAPRSILFASSSPKQTTATTAKCDKSETSPGKGAISKLAELWVATPIDFMFFMIPLLAPLESSADVNKNAKTLFQPLDDIIDSQDELHRHLRCVLYNDSFRDILRERVEAFCHTVEAGDEKMFRFSEKKLLKELIGKAERMVAQGLPASLEEKFVRQPLVTPLMAVKREDPGVTNGNGNSDAPPSNTNEGIVDGDVESESPAEKTDSQFTTTATATTTTTPSGQSTPATQPSVAEQEHEQEPKQEPEQTTPAPVIHLLRLSTALSFLKQSYLPPSLSARIDEMLASNESPIDFTPLTEHLKHVAKLRAEALASRSLADFTRKRALDDDEEGAESRAEKKRRKEEEEKKKKAGESRAVRELKKVDTSGMKKMSDFFQKAGAAGSKKKKKNA